MQIFKQIIDLGRKQRENNKCPLKLGLTVFNCIDI